MPHCCSAVFAPAITFLSMSKGEVYRWELRSLHAIKTITDLCFQAFLRNVVMGMSAERAVSPVLGGTPELCTRECQIPEANSTGWEGAGHRRRREESTRYNLHKPSHLSLWNNFSKCFSNGMVYNNAKVWTRHANQHQKLVFS